MSVYLRDRTTARAVRCTPFTAEGRVLSKVSSCEIRGGRSGTGTGFCSQYFGFPLYLSLHQYYIFIFTYLLLLPEKQTSQAWENSRKQQYSLGKLGALNREVFSLFLSRFNVHKFHYASTLQ